MGPPLHNTLLLKKARQQQLSWGFSVSHKKFTQKRKIKKTVSDLN
jgi:hypothetical protein